MFNSLFLVSSCDGAEPGAVTVAASRVERVRVADALQAVFLPSWCGEVGGSFLPHQEGRSQGGLCRACLGGRCDLLWALAQAVPEARWRQA